MDDQTVTAARLNDNTMMSMLITKYGSVDTLTYFANKANRAVISATTALSAGNALAASQHMGVAAEAEKIVQLILTNKDNKTAIEETVNQKHN